MPHRKRCSNLQERMYPIKSLININAPRKAIFIWLFTVVNVICVLMMAYAFADTLPKKILSSKNLPKGQEPTMKSAEVQRIQYNIVQNGWLTYTDAGGRFSFLYPSIFGEALAGTNRNFFGTEDEEYSIAFPHGPKGIDVVVTKGRVWIVAQALGGLHDSTTLGGIIEVLPPLLRTSLLAHASSLKITNFCEELSKKQHIDRNDPGFMSLTSVQKNMIINLDRTRNIDPGVIKCEVSGEVVTFHKIVTFESEKFKNRQHIYGAVRFLDAPFSSFQIVQVSTEPPTEQLLQGMSAIVRSLKYMGRDG